MFNTPLPYMVMTALGFSWPLITRLVGGRPIQTALFVSIGSAVPIGIGMLLPQFEKVRMSFGNVAICFGAGVFGGIGLLSYNWLIANKKWDLSSTLPTTFVLSLLCMTIGGWLFYKESLPPIKLLGIALALAAVWCLTQKGAGS